MTKFGQAGWVSGKTGGEVSLGKGGDMDDDVYGGDCLLYAADIFPDLLCLVFVCLCFLFLFICLFF